MGHRQQLCTQLAPLAFRSVVEGSCKVGWKARVWFPNGQSATLLEHIGLSLSLSWLIRRLFPRLDRLEAQNIQWLEDLAEAKFEPFGGSRFPMAALILSDRDNSHMDFLIARMVFIARLVLGTSGAKVLDVLSRRFRPPPFVYTRFNLNDQCSAELCRFCDVLSFEGVSWQWSPGPAGGYYYQPREDFFGTVEAERRDSSVAGHDVVLRL